MSGRVKKDLYTKEQLYDFSEQRSFPNDATEAAFLLGGIGTGNVSVGARGELRDWEIFNRPGKGNYLPYTFFAIRTDDGTRSVAKVLEAKLNPPFSKSHGFISSEVGGLPRFAASNMRGEYPFVWVNLEDGDVPVDVQMEAFTPFVPLDAVNSGIPAAIIRYKVHNHSAVAQKVSIVGSLFNAMGFQGYETFNYPILEGRGSNRYREGKGFAGIELTTDLPRDHKTYGNMALTTTSQTGISYKPEWLSGGWYDGITDFWDDFSSDGRLDAVSEYGAKGNTILQELGKVGSLCVEKTLEPGESTVYEFILAWYFPNRVRNWNEDHPFEDKPEVVQNHYATVFRDAWHVVEYLVANLVDLEDKTRRFHEAFFGTTLPVYVLDAVSSTLTVIRSTTCFWLADGTFAAYEGCHDKNGCCPGSCTHVWNYAQTLAFFFPQLEQNMRYVEFMRETSDEGEMNFRARSVYDGTEFLPTWQNLPPAADGQLGCVVRAYREWRVSGDNEFIRTLWPKIKKVINYSQKRWDTDGDGVLDGEQHNTYDIEFYGPNSMINSIFYAALRAGAEIAKFMGDEEQAKSWEDVFSKGSVTMDRLCWNGEYYIQVLEDVNAYRYQYGTGCLSDQVFGQFLAHVAGLGYVLPKEHVAKAVHSIYRYNFLPDFSDHVNPQRTYVLNDEAGLLLCSWPYGGRPKLPFVYSNEVWTGIEYHVAATLIYEGFVEEGLTIVKAVRDRHDGYRRNPWNEVECGHHYARSLASWGVYLALTGYQCDLVEGKVAFEPKISGEHFVGFWITGQGWGKYRQYRDSSTNELKQEFEVIYGEAPGRRQDGC